MPKRKRTAPSGSTFSLMDGNIDILKGLVMHKECISTDFENELISFVQGQCEKGQNGELKKPIYIKSGGARSQGNERQSIMYGGFFDFNRARPGKRGLVPPFPPILERLVDHLISNNYLPSAVRPDSCIINKYEAGDCIPPHVDHQSYYRPISTLSLLGEEPMLVGSRFRTVRACTWAPVCGKSIPLPRRSLLVLGGNSGDIAKHCISSCSGPRISITLRKQPPPDWKPDESELVGKVNKQQFQRGNSAANEVINNPPKKKLSGSAKRRKKMMKQMGGGTEHLQRNAKSSNSGGTKSSATTANKSASSKKKSDKQARRNARRLEKKRAAAAATDKDKQG